MPQKLSGQLVGDKELSRALHALPITVAKSVLRPALRAGAKESLGAIKRRAPRDTGALARSLKVRAAQRSRTHFGAGVRIGEGYFKGDTFYGAFQELGWKTGKRGSGNRRQIPGRRFMRGGLEESKAQVLATVSKMARQKLPMAIMQARAKGKMP